MPPPPPPPPRPEWPIPTLNVRVDDLAHPGAKLFFESVNPADALRDAVTAVFQWLYVTTASAPAQCVRHPFTPRASLTRPPQRALRRPHPPRLPRRRIHHRHAHREADPPLPHPRRRLRLRLPGARAGRDPRRAHARGRPLLPAQRARDLSLGPRRGHRRCVPAPPPSVLPPCVLAYSPRTPVHRPTDRSTDWVRLRANLTPPHWRARPTERWDAGYDATAYFLAWLEARHGPRTVPALNAALDSGSDSGSDEASSVSVGPAYDDAVFHRLTGSTVDDLWRAYCADLRARA